MLEGNAIELLQALSLPRGAGPGSVLERLAAAISSAAECEVLEVWLEEGPAEDPREAARRWRFPRERAEAPERVVLAGSGTLLERVAGSLEAAPSGPDWLQLPGGGAWSPSEALLPFRVSAQARGVLRLCNPSRGFDASLIEQAAVLAQSLGDRLAQDQTEAALRERVKELSCVYRIAQIAAEAKPLEDALTEIAQLLPGAWQRPQATSAEIAVGERVYRSHGFRESAHALEAPVVRGGQARGWVKVFHAEGYPGPPFLPEERPLIEAVARELSSLVERRAGEAERSALEGQLLHADRLATIGLLAAGVAHELNEPLASILGFAQLAQKAPELSDSTRADIERVIKGSLYARDVIRNLLVFSRQSPQQRVETDLESALDQAIALVEPRLSSSRVTLSERRAPDLPRLQADPSQLQQVFLSLFVNAIQSMPDGGELCVELRAQPGALVASVSDTGAGIAPEDLDQVFLPFFTTKDVGEGTGLGLSVVHGIVTAHGGTVSVSSEVGRGTRFEVVLPTTLQAGGPLP